MEHKITDKDLILVTGASGYIACHIVKKLMEKGYRVRGTVRSLKDEKKVAPLRKLVPNPKHELELVETNLLKEETWPDAVKGCTFVIHTASPFPNTNPRDENEIIKPAVNGTLFVLRACAQEEKVKRVVLTSSIAAIAGANFEHNRKYTEKDWPKEESLDAYSKSKTLAEKSAWDFLEERKKKNLPCFELAVINPGYVMGPLLHNTECTSVEMIKKLMNREMPLLPDISFPCCDVRVVAEAHIKAMTLPEANNQRHMIVTTKEATHFKDIARILDEEFKSKNYKVPQKVAPNCLIKMFSIFDRTVRMVVPVLGVKCWFDNSRLLNVLKIEQIPIRTTIIDMAYNLIEKGIVNKK